VRLTQIDHERETVLAIEPGGGQAEDSFGGVVHLVVDPDCERAEYAILVRRERER
jgi:hypothetical protein